MCEFAVDARMCVRWLYCFDFLQSRPLTAVETANSPPYLLRPFFCVAFLQIRSLQNFIARGTAYMHDAMKMADISYQVPGKSLPN